MPSKFPYNPTIDGLRALAIIPVVLFHAGISTFQGGFVGVDIFFVISGYLITSIILKELDNREFSLKHFWTRRFNRLFPAFALVLLSTLAFCYFFSFPGHWNSYSEQAQWTLALLGNVSMMRLGGDYWGPRAESSPFLHYWSLSVEEQFYLCFPIVLIIARRQKLIPLRILLAATAILSFTLCIVILRIKPNWAFYLLPFRAWQFITGAILAAGIQKSLSHPSVSWAGFALAIAAFIICRPTHYGGYPGLQAILPTSAAALLICGSEKKNKVNIFLQSPVILYVGKLSYPIYLWHWPIIVFTKELVDITPVVLCLIFTVTFFLSVLTYHIVELPLSRVPLKTVANFVVFIVCVTSVFGLQLFSKSQVFDTQRFEPVTWRGQLYDNTPLQGPLKGPTAERMTGITVPLRFESPTLTTNYKNNGIVKYHSPENPDLVVVGDSHALMWSPVIDEIGEELDLSTAFFGANGLSPILHTKIHPTPTFSESQIVDFRQSQFRSLDEWKPKVIIFATRYTNLPNAKIHALVNTLKTYSAYCETLVFMEQPPDLRIGDVNALYYASYLSRITNRDQLKVNSTGMAVNALVHDLIRKELPNVRIFTTREALSSGEKAILSNKNRVYYIDDDHLSFEGSLTFKDKLKATLESITR